MGEVEAGVVAQLFGAAFAVVSGGVGCLLAVGWIARRWPQLRTYNGDEPILAGATADWCGIRCAVLPIRLKGH
ncbi:MAG: hypothetical protein KAS38_16685 [Anaerolineales bacterium]|nr:hypothetical protein [Anaerolineales bacterium]